jgi:hypothetical protein
MKKPRRRFSIFLLCVLLLTACNFPTPTSTPSSGGQDAVKTIAALTVQALLASPSNTPSSATETLTPQPTNTTAPTEATAAPSTTETPLGATSTQPTPCDRATYVSETFPDDTEISPEGMFIKTWTLKNNGTCTWNSSYSLVFVKGQAMTTVASKQLTTGTVAPGQDIQISVDLKAPSSDGTYRGDWMLRNASGVLFGLGTDASSVFWVQIKVIGSKVSYFVDNMCAALWSSGAGNLPCPGKTNQSKGFVVRVNAPKLQNGTTDNEPALWTNPQQTGGGFIAGKYPAITVNSGQHFKAAIGCLYNANNCNVKFSVIANADGGPDQILQEWSLNYASPITQADIDLSSLSGKSVVFTLKVTVISGADQPQAYWLKPRLEP